MPNQHIVNFVRTGVAHDDMLGAANSEIAEALADPALAIVLVHSEQRAKDFKKIGRLRDFRRHLLDAIDALVARGRSRGTLDDYGAAVARLYAGSLLEWSGGRKGDWLIGGGDVPESVRRAGVEGFAMGRFDAVQGIRPHRVLRMLQAPEAAAADADPWLKDAVGSALRAALAQLHPAGQPGLHARIRACAVMAYATMDEEAGPAARRKLLDAAGMSADEHARIVAELAGESGVPSLFAVASREPRYDELGRDAPFRAAADRLGVPVNPEEIRMRSSLEQELPQVQDPWVRLAYRTANGSGPGAGSAVSVLKAAGVDRKRRAVVLPAILEGPMVRDPEARAVFVAEMQAMPAGLRLRTFRALFEAVHFHEDPELAREIERSPVMKWFREARAAYVRDAAEFANQQGSGEKAGELLDLLSATLRMPVPPRALAALQADMEQITQEEHRRAAEQVGRLWLFELVRRCADAMSAPETWDGGARVLAAEDQRFIVELVAASKGSSSGSTGPWFACEIPEARKFRMVEAAYRCGIVKREDFRKVVDVAVKRMLAEAARSSLQPSERTALAQLADRCAAHVVGDGSGAAPAWRMLEAFRRLDAREMVAAASTSSAAFPRRGRRAAVVGVRGAVLWAIALGMVLVPVGFGLFASPPKDTGTGARSATVNGAGRPATYSLTANHWNDLGDGRFGLHVTVGTFNTLMPASAVAGEQTADAEVSGMQALEFIDRLKRQAESHREGIDMLSGSKAQNIPIGLLSAVTWRLPTTKESADPELKLGKAWTKDDARIRNPFVRLPLVVILEYRGGNGSK